jgi:dTDP-glucose pyrophosphorylase
MKKMNKKILTLEDSSLGETLKKMSELGKKCLIIADEGKFVGTLSDGDARKALLSGKSIDSPIKGIFNENAFSVLEGEFKKEDLKKAFLEQNYDLIPVLDKKNIVKDIVEWGDLFQSQSSSPTRDMPVVIMAGGEGTRLKPFTNILPKPLIPLNDKTVIEKIIDSFTDNGFHNFFLTVNFKGKILSAFFEELEPDYSIGFVEEQTPLGTAGSLQMLKEELKSTFLLTNCDVIIDLDHGDLIDFHNKNNCELTLVASAKKLTIPYGACEIDEQGFLSKIIEKPSLDYLINAGLYVIEPSALNEIPDGEFFHITDLIEKVKSKGKKVGVFPIEDGAWIDIGQWEEYRSALRKLS